MTPDDLASAVLAGVADQGSKQLLEAEKPVVRAWRKRTGRPGTDVPSTGLALSGGGIRSAAFSLRVIQALVARDLLRRTPGHGITLTSAIAAVLRGVILNLLVWVPILVWVMILLLALSGDMLDRRVAALLVDLERAADREGGPYVSC